MNLNTNEEELKAAGEWLGTDGVECPVALFGEGMCVSQSRQESRVAELSLQTLYLSSPGFP